MALDLLLHEYLVNHSSLHLPGIGNLQFAETTASLDIANKLLTPPLKTLQLDASGKMQDKHIQLGYMIKKLGVSEEEAYNILRQYSSKLQSTIDVSGDAIFAGIGNFEKTSSGIIFRQSSLLNQYLLPVSAERVVRADAQHVIQVGDTETTNTAMLEHYENEKAGGPKDYWWVWALIIAAVSAGLIAWKYYGLS